MDQQIEAALIEALHTGDWSEYERLTRAETPKVG